MPPNRLVRCCVLFAVAASVVVMPPVALADSGTNAQMVSYTNSARAQHGLRDYTVSSDLTSVANRWAAHMASTHTLEDNPSTSSEVCCWTALGENAGEGGSASQIQQAFMNSSEHRSNILSSTYTEVGIGSARSSDGTLWVDEVFRRPTGAVSHYRSSTPSQPVYRAVPSTASRSAIRSPRIGIHRSAARFARPLLSVMFLRQVRQSRYARGGPDAVSGAFGFVRAMSRILR